MEKYIAALQGISYSDWIKLLEGINGAFDAQKGEFEIASKTSKNFQHSKSPFKNTRAWQCPV